MRCDELAWMLSLDRTKLLVSPFIPSQNKAKLIWSFLNKLSCEIHIWNMTQCDSKKSFLHRSKPFWFICFGNICQRNRIVCLLRNESTWRFSLSIVRRFYFVAMCFVSLSGSGSGSLALANFNKIKTSDLKVGICRKLDDTSEKLNLVFNRSHNGNLSVTKPSTN